MKTKELKKDSMNFNKHTDKGMKMLKDSLKRNGAGRSILIDKNDNIIAGNGVAEASKGVIEDVRVIESDGKKLIAVKRIDVDIDSLEGRELALGDNAIGEANLQWDDENIQKAKKQFGLEPAELDVPDNAWGGGFDGLPEELLNQDIGGGTFILLQGDGKTEYNRVRITFKPEDEGEVAERVGLSELQRIVYDVKDLNI